MEVLRKLCGDYKISSKEISFTIDAYIYGNLIEQIVKRCVGDTPHIKTINLAVNCVSVYFKQIADQIICRMGLTVPDVIFHNEKMIIDYRDFTIEVIDLQFIEAIVNTDKLLWNGEFSIIHQSSKSEIEIDDLKHCIRHNYCRILPGMSTKKERIFQLLRQGKFIIEWHYFIENGYSKCVICETDKVKTGNFLCCRSLICHSCAYKSIEHDLIRCKNCKKETKIT